MLPSKTKNEALTFSNVDMIVARYIDTMRDILTRVSSSLTDDKLRTIPIFKDRQDLDRVRDMIMGGYLYNVALSLSNRLAEVPGFERSKDISILNIAKILGGIASTPPCIVAMRENPAIDPINMSSMLVDILKSREDGKFNGLFEDIGRVSEAEKVKNQDKLNARVGDVNRGSRISERAAYLEAAAKEARARSGAPERKAKTAPVGTGPFGLPVRGEGDQPAIDRQRARSDADLSVNARMMKGVGGSAEGRAAIEKASASNSPKADANPVTPRSSSSPPQLRKSNEADNAANSNRVDEIANSTSSDTSPSASPNKLRK